MSFTHLHLHGQIGSRLDAIASSEDYAKKAKELGHTSIAITDHGKLTGWYDHQTACQKYGIKPILGLEQYVLDKEDMVILNDKGKRTRSPNNHLVLLAKNQIGYKNLMQLHYISMKDSDHFYYNNHSTYDEVFQFKEGVICGTACMGSPFSQLFRQGKNEEAEALLDRFLKEFGEDFYVEIQMNEIFGQVDILKNGQKDINKLLIEWADKRGVMKVITGDVHYLEREDYIVQNIALAMQSKKTISDEGAFELESKALYYHDVEDYKLFNRNWNYGYTDEQIEEWCANTQIIADRCNVLIPDRERMILPEVTGDDEEAMIKLSKKGLCEKFAVNKYEDVPQNYRNRLETELDVLVRKGFGSYAMILHDIFEFAKSEDIMYSPGRGSAAGSLVLYCLGITTIDPIEYGLIFERFLSDSRAPNVGYSYFKEFD